MSRFSFAHLLGRAPSAAPPGNPPGTPPAPGPQGQTPPSLQIPPGPAPGAAPPTVPDAAAVAQQAALDQAVAAATVTATAAATQAERQRCAEILAAPEAAGKVETACHLAFETDLPVASAISVLKVTPAATPKGNPLALQQQDEAPQPQVGPAADAVGGANDDAKASAAIINTMKAFGIHPVGLSKEV